MDTARSLAKASWIVMLLYIFANRFVGALVGKALADFFVFLLAAGGLAVAIVCLFLTRRYGRKGILASAIAGVILNTLILGIWIPNFLAARARAMERATASAPPPAR